MTQLWGGKTFENQTENLKKNWLFKSTMFCERVDNASSQ